MSEYTYKYVKRIILLLNKVKEQKRSHFSFRLSFNLILEIPSKKIFLARDFSMLLLKANLFYMCE